MEVMPLPFRPLGSGRLAIGPEVVRPVGSGDERRFVRRDRAGRRRVDAESLAACNKAGQHSRSPATVVTAIECPIAATDRDTTQAALGAIIVNGQIAVLQVAGQGFPIRQRGIRVSGTCEKIDLEPVIHNVNH